MDGKMEKERVKLTRRERKKKEKAKRNDTWLGDFDWLNTLRINGLLLYFFRGPYYFRQAGPLSLVSLSITHALV